MVGARVAAPGGGWRQAGTKPDLGGLDDDNALPAPIGEAEIANPLALGGGLFALRRDRFEALGGFDDANVGERLFALDLSLRLREAGFRSVVDPTLTIAGEPLEASPAGTAVRYMRERWAAELASIAYYRCPPVRGGPGRDARLRTLAWSTASPGREPALAAALDGPT